MRLNVPRCIGILALGLSLFFLALMQTRYDWDYLLESVLPRNMGLVWGFVVCLIVAAYFLSLEEERP